MSLLQMSFSGAILILVIVVIRALAINKLPKKTFLALWGIALFRLLIPFTVPASFSVYSLMKYFAPTHSLSEEISKGNMEPIIPFRNVAAIPTAPVDGKIQNSISLWVIIWLSGMLICAVVFTVTYFKCRKEFKTSLPVRNEYTQKWINEHQILRTIEIRQSDRISTPLTYGVFHPVILLPKTVDRIDRKSLGYILAHEYVHIRRFDTVTKLIATFALCLHWFNPGVWVMYVLANRDIELSCDEAVIRLFGESTRSSYAMAIIQMAEVKSGITPLCSNFCKNAIEERIVAIMKFKKSSFIALALACALVLTVGATFATSANATEASNTGEKVESIVSDEVILSRTNDDGKIQYSADGGKTFLDEDDFQKRYQTVNVEWWTYEEYKAWLENEKEVLQGMLGEKAYTNNRGDFIWTQEVIDETIAEYEKTLQDIKSGIKISKTVDGNEDIMLAQYDDNNVVFGTKKEEATTVFSGYTNNIPDKEYVKAGIEWNRTNNAWFYDGKLVAALYDHNGGIYTCDIKAGEGVTYLEVMRNKKGAIEEIHEVTKDKIEELISEK